MTKENHPTELFKKLEEHWANAVTVDTATGIVSVNKDAFEKSLELSQISKEDYDKTIVHRDTSLSALLSAGGEMAVKAFKENKSLNRVSCETNFGPDTAGFIVNRSSQIPSQSSGTVEKVGTSTVVYGVSGKGTGNAALKAVKKALSEKIAAI